jgi:hypothetical protein
MSRLFREETSMPQTSASPLHDPAVHAVIERARTGRGASLGVSTLYLTAAVRDNGGGIVIGSEIVAAKAEQARANLNEAGLAEFAEIRIGDARRTFADLGGPIDFLLVDGWPTDGGPTLARSVIELTAPQLRPGAIVVNDNGEEDYIAYVRNPANGFLSMPLPLKGSTELSIRR